MDVNLKGLCQKNLSVKQPDPHISPEPNDVQLFAMFRGRWELIRVHVNY